MYKGFNLEIDTKMIDTKRNIDKIKEINYYKIGSRLFDDHQQKIKDSLDKYIGLDGVLDAADIQKDWFPTVDAHVFLSHSHKDKELAICLAGALNKHFKVITFIDSSIWGYSNELLKMIDKRYSLLESEKTTYDYDKRNMSTSHVHTMLASALTKMIHKTECLIFLNTPNSVTTKDACNIESTYSPWIYHEISMSKLVEKTLPRRYYKQDSSQLAEDSSINLSAGVKMHYNIDTDHLFKINESDFDEWLIGLKDLHYSWSISDTDLAEATLSSFYERFCIQ